MDLVGFFDLLSALFVLLICFFTADLSVVVLAGLHSDSVGPQRGPGPSDFEGSCPKLAGSALEGSQNGPGPSLVGIGFTSLRGKGKLVTN